MPLKFVAKYRCQCGASWKVRNTSGGPKPCEAQGCHLTVSPYKKEAITKIFKYKCGCGNVQEERGCEDEIGKFILKALFCRICRKDMPFDSVEEVPRRMFGEFICLDCDRKWFSGNAWPGMGQQCLRCKKMIKPDSLRELRPSFGLTRKEPHKQEYCQMCQKLGFNCRDAPSEQDQPSDTQSVVSRNSSTAGDDDDDDYDVTPVGSDVEDQEELLEKLSSFKL